VYDKIQNVRRSSKGVHEYKYEFLEWKIKCQVGGENKTVRDRKCGVRGFSRRDDDRVQKGYVGLVLLDSTSASGTHRPDFTKGPSQRRPWTTRVVHVGIPECTVA